MSPSTQTIQWTFAVSKLCIFFRCCVSSGCTCEIALLNIPTEPSLCLFPFFLRSHLVTLHVSHHYHRPHAFSNSHGLSLAQQVSHFSYTTGFSAQGAVDCIFPSVSEHKGRAFTAFISLITAHDRLFWTAFLLVSWSNKISNKVSVAQHLLLWFLVYCKGFRSLLGRAWISSGNCNLTALQRVRLEIKRRRQIIEQDWIWHRTPHFLGNLKSVPVRILCASPHPCVNLPSAHLV